MNRIRPKVFILAIGLLGPVLLATHLITSPVLAFSESQSRCMEAKATVASTANWMAMYQPLAARGGMYRKAFNDYQVRSEAARQVLNSCK